MISQTLCYYLQERIDYGVMNSCLVKPALYLVQVDKDRLTIVKQKTKKTVITICTTNQNICQLIRLFENRSNYYLNMLYLEIHIFLQLKLYACKIFGKDVFPSLTFNSSRACLMIYIFSTF